MLIEYDTTPDHYVSVMELKADVLKPRWGQLASTTGMGDILACRIDTEVDYHSLTTTRGTSMKARVLYIAKDR